MRIEVRRHGGFAAIPSHEVRLDVDTATLGAEVAERVAAAVALALPGRPPAPPAGGDRRIYDLALTDEDGRREFRFVEPLDPALRDLVALLLTLEAP